MEIRLLSGAILEVKKWKLAEMEILLQTNGRTFLSTLLKVFEQTTLSVVDPGLYGTFDWHKCYEGDLYDALWQFRELSVSPTYSFVLQCPNKRCQHKIEFDKPIKEIRRNPIRDSIREELAKGNNRIELPWSRGTLTFLIPTAEQAIAMQNANRGVSTMRQKGDKAPVESPDKIGDLLKAKLLKVVVEGETLEHSALRTWIDDLDLSDAAELFSVLEDGTFGVDSGMSVTCGECGQQWDAEVPMSKSFFLPRKTRSGE